MPLEEQQIDRYRLVRLLGSGGMGDVYLAQDMRIEQQVAIKVIRADSSPYSMQGAGEEAARLFQREARAIAKLDHPHILPLFDFGEEQVGDTTIMYLVMPYRHEGSLARWIRQHPGGSLLSPQEVTHIVQQAAAALQHAHIRQVIHQDVKPSNFLLRARDNVLDLPDLLLADFGIARFMTATSSASQSIRGTPSYMAPEQWEGEAVPATDQYALAVMTYELLTGRLPFQGGPGKIMYQHFHVPPQPPSTVNRQLSHDIDTVVLCALAKQPEKRFASITAFATAFQQAAAGIQQFGEMTSAAHFGNGKNMTLPTMGIETAASTAAALNSQPTGNDSPTYMKPADTPVLGSDSLTYIKPAETPAPMARTEVSPKEDESMRWEEAQRWTPFIVPRSSAETSVTKELPAGGNVQTVQEAPQKSDFPSHKSGERRGLLPRKALLLVLGLVILVSGIGTAFLYWSHAQSQQPTTSNISTATAPGVASLTVTSVNTASPVVSPSSKPGVTASSIPTSTAAPSPTSTHTPRPTPTIDTRPLLTINPGTLTSNGNCTWNESSKFGLDVWSCLLTLSNNPNATSNLSWNVSSSDSNVIFYQAVSGTLTPGQSLGFYVYIAGDGETCPGTSTLTIVGTANTVNIQWRCVIPALTATRPYMSLNSDCPANAGGGWTCNTTLSLAKGSTISENWSSSSSGLAGITISPASGTLAPGQQINVRVSLPTASCPINAYANFSDAGNTWQLNMGC